MTLDKMESFGNQNDINIPAQVTTNDMLIALSSNPSNIHVVLSEIHSPSNSTKSMINSNSLKSMKEQLNKWIHSKKYYECDSTVWVILLLAAILVLLMGIGVGYNC